MAHAYILGEVVLRSSLEHSGRAVVCDRQALRLECKADDVNALIWTSEGYIGRNVQFYLGDNRDVGYTRLKRGVIATLTRKTANSGNRSNLISQIVLEPRSSVVHGEVSCRASPGATRTLSIIVSGQSLLWPAGGFP